MTVHDDVIAGRSGGCASSVAPLGLAIPATAMVRCQAHGHERLLGLWPDPSIRLLRTVIVCRCCASAELTDVLEGERWSSS